MTTDVVVDLTDGVLTVTLNRPGKKNALTDEMYRVLADAVQGADTDPAVRVVVLRSVGDIFTAGNDIGEFAALSTRDPAVATDEKHGLRLIRALVASGTPLVAAVQGKAVGIGTTMLLHCDYVILAEGAQLSTPFVNLALVPEAASSLLLTERIGHVRAFAMFALGEALTAPEALAAGLANAIVPADDLHAAAQRVAVRLAVQPAGALAATKRLMRDRQAIGERTEAELAVFREQLAGPEAREAFAAFAEKRVPDFTRFG